MDNLVVISQDGIEDKEAAAEVLTAAFHNYPVMGYVLDRSDPAYDVKLKRMVNFFCEERLWRGLPPLVLRLGDKPIAAALVNPPVIGPPTPGLRQRLITLTDEISVEAMARLKAYEDKCEEMEPEPPHYYLGMIGVLPGHQGQGFARILIEHLHEVVDKDPVATGMCLNTENPNNVPFYRRLGYEVIGEADVGPLHTWCLFRPSRRLVGGS